MYQETKRERAGESERPHSLAVSACMELGEDKRGFVALEVMQKPRQAT